MNYLTEKLEKRYFIGISVRTTHTDGHFQKEVPLLWDKFYRENVTEKISNKINEDLFALHTHYEGDYTKSFTYSLGFEVSSLDRVPHEMIGIEIEASSYAVFTVQGGFPLSMMHTWQAIWDSGFQRSYKTDFEVYKPIFKLPSRAYYNPEITLFIGLKDQCH